MASRDKVAVARPTHSGRREPAGAGGPASDLAIATAQRTNRRSAVVLWLGVALVFLLMASAWVFLFKAAREAKVESVPLEAKGGRP